MNTTKPVNPVNKTDRNKVRVGKNSASYNDKHPENPVILKPIKILRRAADRLAGKDYYTVKHRINKLANMPRNAIFQILQREGFK